MKPIFFDGSFGTYYISKTNDYNACERANITNSNAVLRIHQEYIKAGVDAIKTNTFAATDSEIISMGYNLALQAAKGTNVKIYADIGPKQTEDEYLSVVNTFISLGAKNFLFETLQELNFLEPSLQAIKNKVKDSHVIVSFAVSRDGLTQNGTAFKPLFNTAAKNPNIDAVGLNCICGPTHILELVRQLPALPKPLCVMPNSGYSTVINGRNVYQDNAEYFAEKILEIKQAGASILGGCCGTTPKHIAAAINLVNSTAANSSEKTKPTATPIVSVSPGGKLARKPIAVELSPPIDCNIDFIMQAVDTLKNTGVSTITFTDSPMAKTRADSFLTASLVKHEKNIDVLPHLTCRDKNFIAIKGALLGASFYGVDKVLVITGDPVVNTENYRNPSVFNFNAKELIRYIKNLNEEIFHANPFFIGAALNINATNFSAELARCAEKIKNGAEFIYSQPIFSETSIQNFIQAKKQLNCKLYAGILPVVSYKNAMFLNNELTGIDVPQAVVNNLKDKTPAESRNVSVEFCKDIVSKVYDFADGFYIMTPMKKVDLVCEIIKTSFL